MVVMTIGALIIAGVAFAITNAFANNRDRQRTDAIAAIREGIAAWETNNNETINDQADIDDIVKKDGDYVDIDQLPYYKETIGTSVTGPPARTAGVHSLNIIWEGVVKNSATFLPATTLSLPTEEQLHIFVGECGDDIASAATSYLNNATTKHLIESSRKKAFVFKKERGGHFCEDY